LALHFSGRGRTRAAPLQLATDFSIPFVVTSLQPNMLPRQSDFVIFVSAVPTNLWRALTDVIFPVWAAADKVTSPPTVVLLRQTEQQFLKDELSRFFTVVNLPEDRCCFQ
jgi:hypothetical protein